MMMKKTLRIVNLALAVFAVLLLLAAPVLAAYTAYPTLAAGSSNTGLGTSGTATLGYTVLATDGTTVITARTTAGIVEVGGGNYVVSGGISVPSNTTYVVKWDRSDTSTTLGAATTQPNSLGTDNNTRITTALPNAAPGTAGGELTFGTGAGQINPNGAGAVPASTLAGQTPPANWNLAAIDSAGKVGMNNFPANVLGPQDLLAMEQGIMQYQLGGTKFGAHILNMDANLNGASTPTYNGLAQTSPFTWNGVTYITSVVTRNSQGQVLSKTVTPANQ